MHVFASVYLSMVYSGYFLDIGHLFSPIQMNLGPRTMQKILNMNIKSELCNPLCISAHEAHKPQPTEISDFCRIK